MTRNLKEFVNHNVDVSVRDEPHGERHVAVLLAHYNGDAYLGEQLHSLSAQTHHDWSLILSDDGSSDDWLETTVGFARTHPGRHVSIVNGPRLGSARNFLSLVAVAGSTVPFAAFCDQDDVWLPRKLEKAVAALDGVGSEQPALYCGRTMICDRQLVPLGPSPLFQRPPGFRNALVQNIAGGNTMVLNRAALDLLQDTMHHASDVVSHDWWAYQIISGAGGRVIYDPEPSVLYRQHDENQVGANASWTARFKRIGLLFQGQFRSWNTVNTAALGQARHWLTSDAQTVLERFQHARSARLRARIVALRDAGLYRQTMSGQLALWCATLLRKT